jgi:hypothetical protein
MHIAGKDCHCRLRGRETVYAKDIHRNVTRIVSAVTELALRIITPTLHSSVTEDST